MSTRKERRRWRREDAYRNIRDVFSTVVTEQQANHITDVMYENGITLLEQVKSLTVAQMDEMPFTPKEKAAVRKVAMVIHLAQTENTTEKES